ncbi:cytochrome P450 [Streptomyces sp. NPDC058534]|uniref:cytochrome P450 n=1 Tax=Streptomyces sp. NPDC058534 TaxID=3346541 RepID=UPI00365CB20E
MPAKTVFSGSPDDATFGRLRADLSVVMNGVGARVMPPDWVERLPLPVNRRFTAARDAVRATIDRAVTDLQDSGHDTGDMLSPLLCTTDEETGRPLSGHQISSATLTLAVAGTEATASVLSWVLYELARHPEVGTRVPAELDEVLGDRPVAFEDLGRLPYLGRVLDETLRLHHTGWLVTRRTVTETRLGPWTVPAGTELAYCRHALHRDPVLVPDPPALDPDRWAGSRTRPSQAFLPFGAGKHKCIGDRFALTELLTAVATNVRRVRLELPPGRTVRPVAAATVRPRTLLMTVRPRDDTPPSRAARGHGPRRRPDRHRRVRGAALTRPRMTHAVRGAARTVGRHRSRLSGPWRSLTSTTGIAAGRGRHPPPPETPRGITPRYGKSGLPVPRPGPGCWAPPQTEHAPRRVSSESRSLANLQTRPHPDGRSHGRAAVRPRARSARLGGGAPAR